MANQADVLEVDPSTLYESVETRAFEIAQLERELPGSGSVARLSPPQRLRPIYVRKSVDLVWAPGLPNIELNKSLPEDMRLAYRVYRGVGPSVPELIATVDFGEEALRDENMPLAASSLSYEVWAVLLRGTGEDEDLMSAERSDRVTVTTPDHFTVVLLTGSADAATFLMTVTAGDQAGTVTRLSASPNDELLINETTTGLTLTSLVVADDPRIEQRERLTLTSDGSLILEPGTRRPQTMQTPVLMTVTRLQATLVNEAGEPRNLEVDLP